MKDKDY